MQAGELLITKNLDIWASAVKAKSSAGRGTSKKIELYGIKKLRELILELAVRGLLVPQDPKDEPASELLKKIAKEKAKLVKEGEIKKQKPLPEIKEHEKPFKLPKGWEWVRLSEIGHDWGQITPTSTFTYIDVGAINKDLGYISDPTILSAEEAPSRARKIVKKGTVIYSTVRPYLLNIAIINQNFDPMPIASTAFAVIHPFKGVHPSFVYRYLRSPVFIKYVEACQTGIAYPAVNDRQFFSGIIPVSPELEQHRIVSKVDELMALCDELEKQQEDSISAHQILVRNLLSALTNAGEKGEFEPAWKRIAENFDILFTTESSIEELKQTILQLAVMGKLVPQDPNDESASVLLKKIAKEKEKLVKEGKIKKQKPLPEIREDEKPFKLPVGWEWVRLGEFSLLRGGYAYSSKNFISESSYQVIRMGNIRPDDLRLNENPVFITSESAADTKQYRILKGDVLLTMTGTKGKRDYLYSLVVSDAHLQERELYLNQRLCSIQPLLVDPNFLSLVLKNCILLDKVYSKSTGSANQANIGMDAIGHWVLPVPSNQEQHRIIARVNYLMTLCNQLKLMFSTSQITQWQIADCLAKEAVG